MFGFFLGEKKGCDRVFTDKGLSIPVTRIIADECYLVDIQTDKDKKPLSIKLAFKEVRRIKKPVKGELKKQGIEKNLRYIREFRIKNSNFKMEVVEGKKQLLINDQQIKVGEKLSPTIFFKLGDKVDVSGVSKGKGFQGAIKRHGFACGPRTHGQSDRRRAPGSLGETTTPGRVYKGKRMAGRMGNDRVTIKGLEVINIDDKEITVKGLIPGHKGNIVEIKLVDSRVK